VRFFNEEEQAGKLSNAQKTKPQPLNPRSRGKGGIFFDEMEKKTTQKEKRVKDAGDERDSICSSRAHPARTNPKQQSR